MRVLLLPNQTKKEALALMPMLIDKLIALGHEPLKEGDDKADIILFLGGDGTFIRYAPFALKDDIPFGGINVGNYGYLTNCSVDDLNEWLYGLDEYDHDECLILKNDDEYIINDIVFKAKRNIETFYIYDDHKLIHTVKASGLIISTPLGSTGINRSANGPILDISLDDIVITPILAQRNETPPFIYHIKKDLTIKGEEKYSYTIDGQNEEEALEVKVKVNDKKLKKIHRTTDL